MVCVPCIVIPVFLFIWHKYLQPLVLRFWGPLPWDKPAVQDTKDTPGGADNEKSNKTCPFTSKSKATSNGAIANGHSPQADEVLSSEVEHKKID